MAESDAGSGRLRGFARPFGTLMGDGGRGVREPRGAGAGTACEIDGAALAEMGDRTGSFYSTSAVP
ncbi:hypothetical protein HOK021_06920 [Streptomyces hygroscopicus]|nr:hypothetical protein HOK021_06920 [Streptomyces hygroscopicus]